MTVGRLSCGRKGCKGGGVETLTAYCSSCVGDPLSSADLKPVSRMHALKATSKGVELVRNDKISGLLLQLFPHPKIFVIPNVRGAREEPAVPLLSGEKQQVPHRAFSPFGMTKFQFCSAHVSASQNFCHSDARPKRARNLLSLTAARSLTFCTNAL